jgi:hypothetical protein
MRKKTLWRKFTQDHELNVMYKCSEPCAYEYTNKEGYRGRLVPWQSERGPAYGYTVWDPNGREILHAGYSSLRTMSDLVKNMDELPELLAVLKRKFGEIYNDTEGDDAEI